MTKISVRRAVRVAAVGLIAAVGFAMAQDASTQTSTSASTNGGWRKVGDTQDPAAVSNSNPQGSNPQASYPQASNPQDQGPVAQNAPPPPNYPASNYPPPQQNGPGQSQQDQSGQYPGQQQYPMQRPPMQPANNGPVPAQITVPAGTYLTVRVNQQLSSDHNQPGDAFSATLARPLVANGVVLAEPGQTIGGRVSQAQKAGRVEGLAKLGVELTDLSLVDGQNLPIKTTLVSRTGNSSVGRDAGAIAGTTALGAAVGAAADWGRGAAIGAGAGAAVGIIGVLVTRGQPSVIYPEQTLTFKLEQPLTVSTEKSPQAFRYVQPGEYDQPPAYAQGAGYGYGAPGPVYGAAPVPYAYPYYAYGYGYPYYPYYGGFGLFVGRGYGWGRGYYGGRYYGGFARGGGVRR